jgi:hypothetical protein
MAAYLNDRQGRQVRVESPGMPGKWFKLPAMAGRSGRADAAMACVFNPILYWASALSIAKTVRASMMVFGAENGSDPATRTGRNQASWQEHP